MQLAAAPPRDRHRVARERSRQDWHASLAWAHRGLPVWKVNILFTFRTKTDLGQLNFSCDINNIYYGTIFAKIFFNNIWEVLMDQKPIDIAHKVMTNQFVILGVAIFLFLLVITLVGPGESQAVIPDLWI